MNSIRSTLPISIYDRSGMIQVSRMTKDFAPTSNGTHTSLQKRPTKKIDASEFDFEAELERAMYNEEHETEGALKN